MIILGKNAPEKGNGMIVIRKNGNTTHEPAEPVSAGTALVAPQRDRSHLVHLGEGAPPPKPWFPKYRVIYDERRAALGQRPWRAQARVFLFIWGDILGIRKASSTEPLQPISASKNPINDSFWETREEAMELVEAAKRWDKHRKIVTYIG